MTCANRMIGVDARGANTRAQRWVRLLRHNPNPRKFLTLLTKTGCSPGGFSGVFDNSICGYIACACLYLNSRHNSVTKWPD